MGKFSLCLLWFIISIWTCSVHAEWQDPPFKNITGSGFTVAYDGTAFSVIVNEELSDDAGIDIVQINYDDLEEDLITTGAKDFGVTIGKKDDLGLVLKLIKSPDFEYYPSADYRETIKITDSNQNSKEIIFKLKNLDDNDPQIEIDYKSCNIKEEEEAPKTLNCTIQVHDDDGCADLSQFKISIQGEDTDVFQITGKPYQPLCLDEGTLNKNIVYNLSYTKTLDYEEAFSYFISIISTVGNHSSDAAQMIIQVTDIPDTPPVWVNIPPTINVDEKVSKTVAVKAVDGDSSIGADICYKLSLKSPDDDEQKQYFSIEKELGAITIGEIDRDTWQINSYTLEVTAFECDDETSSVPYTIVVMVTDSINVPPKCNNATDLSKDVFEGTTVTYIIECTDPDEGDQGTFNVSLSGDGADMFSVIPTTGFKNGTFTIQNIAPLNYESDHKIFNLKFSAKEPRNEIYKNEIDFVINVKDVNDNSPTFKDADGNGMIAFTVKENSMNGKTIGTIAVEDLDENDKINFTMTYKGLTVTQVNDTTGQLTISGDNVFDYERQKEVQAQVTAIDGDGHRTMATVNITVEDQNDVHPTINVGAGDTPSVNEDAAENDPVNINISATDVDLDASLEVSINWDLSRGYKNSRFVSNENFKGWFAANVDTANATDTNISITVAKPLDWVVADTIQLQIMVTDTNTKTGSSNETTFVSVAISDVNNNAPKFDESYCDGSDNDKFKLKENSKDGVLIGSLLAVDPDGPPFNNVTYAISDDPHPYGINIDSSTGLLSSGGGKLDYEETSDFVVDITASDGTLSSTCKVKVMVIDVNDNSPEVSSDNNEVYIPENSVHEEALATISANDNDITSAFNTVTFKLTKGTEYFELRNSNDARTELYMKPDVSFDYENTDTRQIVAVVAATDNPDGQGDDDKLTGTTTITINIIDVNDNAPLISNANSDSCMFSKPETTVKGLPLSDEGQFISATDQDSDVNNTWTNFAINSVECKSGFKVCPDDNDRINLFSLTGNSDVVPMADVKVQVSAGQNLNNKFGQYLVEVKASNIENSSLYDTKSFLFCITDVNDHAPTFVYPKDGDSISIKQENGVLVQPNGEGIPLITVEDLDFGENAEPTIKIEENENFRLTIVNLTIAKLDIKKDFDDLPSQSNLKLTVCDEKMEDTSTNCETVTFTVKTIASNEKEPTFGLSNIDHNFRENSTTENTNIPPATDANNENMPDELKQQIYYYIIDGDTEIFSVESTTGVLSLKAALDAYVNDHYTLIIQASNYKADLLPKPEAASVLNFTIHVEDINDKWPIFDKPVYTVSITSNELDHQFLKVTATDHDANSTLSYAIVDGSMESHLEPANSAYKFGINKQTSDITCEAFPGNATRGYVSFSVSVTDEDETHKGLADVMVYVVPAQYLYPFVFMNSYAEVGSHLDEVIDLLSETFAYTCRNSPFTESGNLTTLPVHFVDEKTQIPIEPSVIDVVKDDYGKTKDLQDKMLGMFGLNLVRIGTNNVIEAGAETVNIALIVMASILLAAFVILAVFSFVKTRRLNTLVNKLTNATADVNDKKQLQLPNTNLHQEIGSNPIWNTEIDNRDLDSLSSTSSNGSGLNDIEDNPEFLAFYNEVVSKGQPDTIGNLQHHVGESPNDLY